MPDWNDKIIEEFRANEGRVGGPFEGHTLLLLHHKGAKSGTERVNPLAAQALSDDSWAVFASKGGAPTNPDWFHNLLANPEAEIEIGTDRVDVLARVAGEDERDEIWTKQKQIMPGFAEYEEKTSRQIPVVVLDRHQAPATNP
jgi:deazaflavin-dependent oxidoreductase (nitroreductase family)